MTRSGRRTALVRWGLAAVVVLTSATTAACSDDDGDLDAFCAQLRRVPVITERDDLTVPDTATATNTLVTELRRLEEAAPAEIRGDVAVLVDVAEDLATALSGGDEASAEAARQRLAKSGDAWKAASDNVVIYASANCGLDLGAPG